MPASIKNNFLFHTLTLFLCITSFFVGNTAPAIDLASESYTFETIAVPGVDFLAVTANE